MMDDYCLSSAERASLKNFSARCYRKQWTVAVTIIDTLFFWQKEHCKSSRQWELDRKDLPVEYRN
ncbi:MAG: hypothetical protein LBT46_08900 [Planctomycetaceae bacterium]|jgi:hypothetical protein|nr:hypothetical protein [Planctomycetaceae bacterium]